MDIRAIIETDDRPKARHLPGAPNVNQAPQAPLDNGFIKYGQPNDAACQRDSRPPQLSSIHTPGYQGSRYLQSPSTGSASSPNQFPQSASRTFGRYPSPHQYNHSPPNSFHTAPNPSQDHRSSLGTPTYPPAGPSTPIARTPTGSTPGSASAYSNWARPTSSHSASTPTSAQYPPPHVFKESPQSAALHVGPIQHPQPSQTVSPQQSAPLGPPSLRYRPSLDGQLNSPVTTSHRRSNSGDMRGHRRQNESANPLNHSPPIDTSSLSRNNSQDLGYRREREQSISVSPKTKLANLPTPTSLGTANGYHADASDESFLGNEKPVNNISHEPPMPYGHEPPRPIARRSISMGIDSMLNAAPSRAIRPPASQVPSSDEYLAKSYNVTPAGTALPSSSASHQTSNETSSISQASMNISQQSRASHASSARHHIQTRHTSATSASGSHDDHPLPRESLDVDMPSLKEESNTLPPAQDAWQAAQIEETAAVGTELATTQSQSPSAPVKKKARLDSTSESTMQDTNGKGLKALLRAQIKKPPRMPMPIFAQSIRDYGSIENFRARSGPRNGSKAPTNGHTPTNGISKPAPQQTSKGPLGHWEPSIMNVIPSDEVVKAVSDFLFVNVVLQNDQIGVAAAGGAAGRGAVLEIEAKIGRIMDKNTTDRLRLPVLTETVFNRNDVEKRTTFESSMTEAQHRTLNGFLNKALLATQAPKATPQNPSPTPHTRVRMDYKHTRETDTFFELSQNGLLALPASLNVDRRNANKVKVRITHDQKTGKELAKIVKTRLADMDIYSPNNQADWRISVNVEMDFQGDMRDLIEPDRKGGRGADRNKDRMSYRHQAYQIDLTQVTPAEGATMSHKEHELEIEVSSEEVRRQGTLLQKGQPNQFMDLVSGFVDNVRTLARQVPEDRMPPPQY